MLTFTKTIASDFTILTNAVDSNIEIICHNETGFYNITKIAKLITKLKEVGGIPPTSQNSTKYWFRMQAAKELIEECKRYTDDGEVVYELKSGTPVRFAGTYVHELLYQSFMQWLDAKYGIKVCIILRNIQQDYNKKALKEKDDKLDKITQQLTAANNKIDRLENLALDQTKKIDALIVYSEDMNEKLDIFFDFMIGFARMTIPMWNGSSVFKTQLDNLAKTKTTIRALNLLKVMFVVAFYAPCQRPYNVFEYKDKKITIRTQLKLYFCCRNFGEVNKRISELSKRHASDMFMLQPMAIGLISQEVNTEHTSIEQMDIFPDRAFIDYDGNTKSFDIYIHQITYNGINNVYSQITVNTLSESFQEYQMHMRDASADVNEDIITHLTNADNMFYADVWPYCQKFIDCFYTESYDNEDNFVEYVHCTSSTTKAIRPDCGNYMLTDSHYALFKIKDILDEDRGTHEIDNMVKTGVISKKNIKSLKKVAEIENIDISNVQFPDNLEDDL